MPRDESQSSNAYGRKALANECEAIRMAAFGQQEHTINAASLKIGSLVAGGRLDGGIALAALLAAALSVPPQPGKAAWSAAELEKKVRRSFRAGLEKPRDARPEAGPSRRQRPIQPVQANAGAQPQSRIVQTYDYTDEAGALLFQAVRLEPKSFRQRQRGANGHWVWNLEGVRRVLYRLPELLASPPSATVFIPEGEKDVDNVRALGLVATCNPMGAEKWLEEYGQFLAGADAVLLSDNDAPGQRHVKDVAAKLEKYGKRVRILEMPRPHKDVSDWIAAGGTAAQLLEMANKVPSLEYPTESPVPSADDATGVSLPMVWFDQIKPSLDVMDFIQGVLVEKSAAVVFGDSNAGKTFWTTDLALHVAAGQEWNGRRVEQGCVIYCVLEGSRGFRNRVIAWKHRHGLEDASIPFAVIELPLDLMKPDADTPRLIAAIRAAAARIGIRVKLVVIDTLSRALAGGNESSSDDMGALVMNMDTIRAETGACVMFIHHSGKDQTKGARGWSGLRAAIDTEIEMAADEAAGTSTATVVKQREMKKGDAFSFRLETVVLGQNRHGEDVTTCVVEQTEQRLPSSKKIRLSDDQTSALRVLQDVIALYGERGHTGVPLDFLSVPEGWWRDRFYERCKIGSSQDTKKKAYQRIADKLQRLGKVAADGGRVWLPYPVDKPGQTGQGETCLGLSPLSPTGQTGHHPFRDVPSVPGERDS